MIFIKEQMTGTIPMAIWAFPFARIYTIFSDFAIYAPGRAFGSTSLLSAGRVLASIPNAAANIVQKLFLKKF